MIYITNFIEYFQTLICYNDPASHPYIPKEERDYLQTEMGQLKRHDNLTTPWRKILTSVPVLAYICAQVNKIELNQLFKSFMNELKLIYSIDWSRFCRFYYV